MPDPSTAATPPDRRRMLLRLVPLLCVALALGVALYAGAGKILSFENFLQSRESLAAYTQGRLAQSLLIFIGVYAAATALAVPGALFLTITGGFLFGGWLGAAATVVGATMGGTFLFLVARTSLSSTMGRVGGRIERLRQGFANDGASYMLFLRLVPVFPFFFVNLAAAALGVKLRTFVWTTMLGILPATIAYSLTGAGLDSIIAAQKKAYEACISAGMSDCRLDLSPKSLVTREMILAFAALGVTALLPALVKKWRARSSAGAEPNQEPLT